jgi:hypothetical protein
MGKRAAVAEVEDEVYEESPDPEDVLSRGWKVAMYGAALVPYFGSWFVVLGSSILFYVWRKEHPNKANSVNRHGWLAWLLGIVVWGGIWFLQQHGADGGADAGLPAAAFASPRARRSMDDIYAKVANDAVERYEMAKRQGDPIQTCVQAMGVSAAWLQAKNEARYQAAKATESADCAHAGMPR